MKFFFSLFVLFSSFLCAEESEDVTSLIERYAKFSERKIAGIQDDLPSRVIYISLSDGTRWEGHYESYADRQNVLHWKIGSSVSFLSRSFASKEGYGLSSFKPYANLTVFLDLNTADVLPKVTNISNGLVTLSDGSSWQESSYFYYASNYWKIGDRILVSCVSSPILLNVDQSRDGLILDTHFMYGNIVDWINPNGLIN